MNVTQNDIWNAYKAARRSHDQESVKAGTMLGYYAGNGHNLSAVSVDALGLPVRAAQLEAEQLYREYTAMDAA